MTSTSESTEVIHAHTSDPLDPPSTPNPAIAPWAYDSEPVLSLPHRNASMSVFQKIKRSFNIFYPTQHPPQDFPTPVPASHHQKPNKSRKQKSNASLVPAVSFIEGASMERILTLPMSDVIHRSSSPIFTNPFSAPSSPRRRRTVVEPLPLSPTSVSVLNPWPQQPRLMGSFESTQVSDDTASWTYPDSWVVSKQGDGLEAPEYIGLDEEEESGAQPLRKESSLFSINENEGDNHTGQTYHASRKPSRTKDELSFPFKITIHRSDGAYYVITCPPDTNVAQLLPILHRKLAAPNIETHRLYLREHGRERLLAPTEKPALIVQQRLELAGYDASDGLENVGASEIEFLVKFEFKSELLGGGEEQEITPESVEFVDLVGRSLRTVPILLHRHAPTIVTLNLSKNPLLDVPLDFLLRCTLLRELRLSDMALKKVPQSVRHSISLHRLDLSCNRIVDLEETGLDLIPELFSLSLLNNRLERLPTYFRNLNDLRFLNISNNRINIVPEVVWELRSLVDLDMSFNTISHLPSQLAQLRKLQRLIIVGNKITGFPEECAGLVSLSELDCRRNIITNLSVICRLPALETLRADYNAIQSLDLSLGPNFKTLEITHNGITRLALFPEPTVVVSFSLTNLDISHAKLSSLDPFALAGLTSLTSLKMDFNSFHSIPETICSFRDLSHFSCSNNQLNALPARIGQLQKLVSLDAHSNHLVEVPRSIWHCCAVEYINMTSNFIRFWPDPPMDIDYSDSDESDADSVDSQQPLLPLARSLKRLYLGENQLEDEAVHRMSLFSELTALNLSFNEIREIPPSLPLFLSQLEELYLSGNKLTILPSEHLHRFTNLMILFLNGNKLQTLPAELSKVKTLTVLDVGNNVLKYNVNNWGFEWNWNFNPQLRYLNLSGNKRLEIKRDTSSFVVKTYADSELIQGASQKQLAEFTGLKHLRLLGLMDVMTLFMPSIPDQTEDRRVRTSSSEINGMAYGIADTLGKLGHVSVFDLALPHFRAKKDESLFGIFARVRPFTGDNKSTKYLLENFETTFIEALDTLNPDGGEGIAVAMRRTFLLLNKRLYKHLVSLDRPRKASTASTASGTLLAEVASLRTGVSAVVVYIVAKMVYVANAGNALAVVSRGGMASMMSRNHDPFDSAEAARIRSAEGWVSPKGMVNDEVDVSRSLGYYHLLPVVNSCPDVSQWRLSDKDEFIIVGNGSLWDHVSAQTAVDIARDHRDDPMMATQRLRDIAISYGADGSTMVMIICVADLFKSSRNSSRRPTIDGGLNIYPTIKHQGSSQRLLQPPDPNSVRNPIDYKTEASTEPEPVTSLDLRGKTVHFADSRNDSPTPDEPSMRNTKFAVEGVPNLSGRIKIIQRPLRAGGFCDVYSGELIRDPDAHSEIVAMKMLRLFNTELESHLIKAKKKFRREVRLWCSLSHPYVLPFYGTCELDESRLFMVSPWAAGGNSLHYLRENPLTDRNRLLWQTSSALRYLHSGKDIPQVVHGDLKADNVLISSAGDALLCDFGLSRHVEDIISKSGSSSAGRGGGHARFTAPELLLPPKDTPEASRPSPQSDVFAFASLMLQIYTEQLPFGNLTLEPLAIFKIAKGELPPRPEDPIVLERGCDDHVWAVMADCWKFQPGERPTMEEIMNRMAALGPYHVPEVQ